MMPGSNVFDPVTLGKGRADTDQFKNSLVEELNCETVFKIPIFGGIEVSEATVVTWIIMAALTLLAILFVRNLKVENPGKIQVALESGIGWAQNFFDGVMGVKGRKYVPYLLTVLIYLAVSNLIGMLGFKPPTKDFNVTLGISILSLFLIEGSGFKERGVKGKLKSLAEPVAVILPINLMEVVVRPISLCMRLFGNVLGSYVVMELIKLVIPVLIPIPFSLYFDVFDGLIQAYVFVFLTALFIGESMGE